MHQLILHSEGSVHCKSDLYAVLNYLPRMKTIILHIGENVLLGDIDDGYWSVSYLLSMYPYRKKDFIAVTYQLTYDKQQVSAKDIAAISCYMDTSYPLFATRKSIRKLIEKGIQKNHLSLTVEEVADMVGLSRSRLDRPVKTLSRNRFRAMAAIAYVYGKQIYCYPWMSDRIYNDFITHIHDVNQMLTSHGMMVILPKGYPKPFSDPPSE